MDLKNLCRTCLRMPKEPINLLGKENVLQRINAISSAKIEILDELPANICEECYKNVNHFYNFQKLIIHTDQDLKSRLKILKQTEYFTQKLEKTNEKLHTISTPKCTDTIELVNIKNEQDIRESSTDLEYTNQKSPEEQVSSLRKQIHNCSRCNAIFHSRNRLAMHRVQIHMPKLMCNICGVEVREYNFRRHMSIHSAPTRCTICGKQLKNENSLRCHQRTHKKPKYFCKICGKGYVLPYEYKKHYILHTADRNRIHKKEKECSVCGKNVLELNRHMLIHTGERPHVCPHCNKGFQKPFGLKMHIRQHTNERPFVCEHCGSAFPQVASLNTHLKRKHKIYKE